MEQCTRSAECSSIGAVGLSTAHIGPLQGGRGQRASLAHRIAWADGGCSVELHRGRTTLPAQGGGIRGCVNRFTAESRRRLLHRVMSVDQRAIEAGRAWFVTLTYPGDWNRDPESWKANLKAWKKRLARTFGEQGTFWKMEFQKRGAPHFHLLVCADGCIDRSAFQEWASRSWYEVVGSGDERHLRCGTNVQAVRSWREVGRYAGKYLGKREERVAQEVNQETGEVVSLGRFWGVWWESLLPIAHVHRVLSWSGLVKARRVLSRIAGRRRQGDIRDLRVFASWQTVERLAEWIKASPPHRRYASALC